MVDPAPSNHEKESSHTPVESEQFERMSPLLRWTLYRPITVFVLFLAFLVVGFIAYPRLEVQLMPEGINMGSLSVWIPVANSTPQEVLEEITKPTEDRIRTIPGIRSLYSRSSANFSQLIISYDSEKDPDSLAADVRERLDRAKLRWPEGVDRYNIWRGNMDADLPVYIVAIGLDLEGDKKNDDVYQSDVFENVIQNRLLAIGGVANVEFWGLTDNRVIIDLDNDLVAAHQVPVRELIGRLSQDNQNITGGKIRDGDREYLIRSVGRFNSFEEVDDYPVTTSLKVSDVADVGYQRALKNFYSRVNGNLATVAVLKKDSMANTVEVCENIKLALKELEESLPRQMASINEFTYFPFLDQGEIITVSIDSLKESGIYGGIMAFLVLFVFFRRFKVTFIVTMAIPFSLLITIVWLYFDSGSFNILSIMGMSLGIGMLVDNSIVVVENIVRKQDLGMKPIVAAAEGLKEIGLAVSLATLTTVVVFVPIMFMTSIPFLKVIFQSVGGPLCVSVLASLFVALVFIPQGVLFFHRKPVKERPVPEKRPKIKLIESIRDGFWSFISTLKRIPIIRFFVPRGFFLKPLKDSSVAQSTGKENPLASISSFYRWFSNNMNRIPILSWVFVVPWLLLFVGPVLVFTRLVFKAVFIPLARFFIPRGFFLKPLKASEENISFKSEKTESPFESISSFYRWFWNNMNRIPILSWIYVVPGLLLFYGPFLVFARGVLRTIFIPLILHPNQTTRKWLGWCLAHRFGALIILVSVLMTAYSLLALKLVPVNFDTQEGVSRMELRVSLPKNLTLREINDIFDELERAFYDKDNPEIQKDRKIRAITSYFSSRSGGLNLIFEEGHRVKEEEFFKTYHKYIPEIPGVKVQLRTDMFEENDRRKRIRVFVRGTDLGTLNKLGDEVLALLQDKEVFPELYDARPMRDDSRDEVRVSVNRELAQHYGIDAGSVSSMVSWAIRGAVLPDFVTADRELPFWIRYQDADKENVEEINAIQVLSDKGTLVRLDNVAKYDIHPGPGHIRRMNGKMTVAFSAESQETEDAKFNQLKNKVSFWLSKIPVEEGFEITQDPSGRRGAQGDFTSLIWAGVLAICLVFFVMGLLFESFIMPFSVLLSIPFAFFGSIWGLFLSGIPLDPVGVIGMVILVGIVVNNAIVLVDSINRNRSKGNERTDAILEASRVRFRPIWMTAMTTIFGLIPLVLLPQKGEGIDYKAMAMVIIGGLFTSTFFTLFVVPLFYTWLDDLRRFFITLFMKPEKL